MLSCLAVETEARTLAAALDRVGRGLLLVVTGAGVSAPSGLPTFRGTDPDAVWNRDVTEVGTRRFFERNPVDWWQWFLDRFGGLDQAAPNAAHHALADLERRQTGRGGDFLLVTQNVDLLHERAGSERLIKIHGTVDRLRCSRDGCRLGAPAGSLAASEADFSAFLAAPQLAALPRCPACGALLRAHALLFDEIYDEHRDYRFREVLQALERIGLVLFVGTSFSVGITDIVLREALGWKVPVLSIDPGAQPPASGVTALRAPAEVILPEALALLP